MRGGEAALISAANRGREREKFAPGNLANYFSRKLVIVIAMSAMPPKLHGFVSVSVYFNLPDTQLMTGRR